MIVTITHLFLEIIILHLLIKVVPIQVTKRIFQTTIVLSVLKTLLAIQIEPAVFVKMDITKFPVIAQNFRLAMVSLLFVFFQQFKVTKAYLLYFH